MDAGSCLADGLRGQLSARPDQLHPRTAESGGRRDVGNRVVAPRQRMRNRTLYDMDPVAFEDLVADLFRAMGMQAVTTQRSNDGGVDVDALDPTPIRGGKIVVQVKRYRNTVPPTAVRDLYGTVQDAGRQQGRPRHDVRLSAPASHTFANGKPLELISGSELVDLLHRHGLRGRLGEGGRPAAARPAPSSPQTRLPDDYNVLGMSWTGSVALDVCALVCHGNRVLSDDHFVFFNNPQTPDGSVRALPPTVPDKAAICVSFDGLPAEADRFVLVAAIDPEVNPDADLSGFTDACIRLLDPGMSELGRLEVSDGRPLETALVLGSFRRRSSGGTRSSPRRQGLRGRPGATRSGLRNRRRSLSPSPRTRTRLWRRRRHDVLLDEFVRPQSVGQRVDGRNEHEFVRTGHVHQVRQVLRNGLR